MAALKSIPKVFDDAKLATMVEPFTVRVDKLRNGQRQPIPLPESEEAPGEGGGVGYDKQSVRGLEQFLVTEWSGGGVYDIKVTDAQGVVLQWMPSWNISEFPEKTPPPLQGAVNPNPVMPPATKRNFMPAFPNGFPSFQQVQQPFGGYQQPYQQQFYPPMPPPPMVGTPQYAMWSHEAKERSESAELRALREENQRREREAIEARHKSELERDRQATEARFNAQTNAMSELRNMITALTAAIQTGAHQQKQPDNQLEALKLQLQAQESKADADRRDREQERRERETRDMMKSMGEASQKQIDAMTRQLDAFQSSLTAVNANRQDPMIEMLREQARQSAEAIKEISRSNAAQVTSMQASMLNPRDILALAKESSAAADQVTDKLTTTFGRVLDLQTKVTENALQLQPQGSPVIDMVRDGATHVKEMADRYFGRAELQAKLAAAQQEQLLHAQRDVQIAQIRAQNPGLAGHQIEAGPEQQHVHNGHVNHQTPKKKKTAPKAVVDATGQPIKIRKTLGKTDVEWFGPIADDINQLRTGVAEYLESVQTNRVDGQGQPIGISAEQAGQVIAQGTAMVIQAQVNIQAMTLLLFEQRYAEFMEVVLPDAPEPYRADVLNVLISLLRGEVGGGEGMTGVEPEGEQQADDDDDDDDEKTTDKPDDKSDDDGSNTDQDGADGPARAAQASPVPPVLRSIGPNGKPTNPPRRT